MSDPTTACNVQQMISGVLASIEPRSLKLHLLQWIPCHRASYPSFLSFLGSAYEHSTQTRSSLPPRPKCRPIPPRWCSYSHFLHSLILLYYFILFKMVILKDNYFMCRILFTLVITVLMNLLLLLPPFSFSGQIIVCLLLSTGTSRGTLWSGGLTTGTESRNCWVLFQLYQCAVINQWEMPLKPSPVLNWAAQCIFK